MIHSLGWPLVVDVGGDVGVEDTYTTSINGCVIKEYTNPYR